MFDASPARTVRRFLHDLQNLSRRIVSRNSANRAAAERTGPAEKNIFPFGLNSPGPNLLFGSCERPGGRVLKNIAMIHA